MKMLRFLFAVVLVAGFASMSWAAAILNQDGDGIEDVGGVAYATYQNSGEFLFLEAGNTTPLSGVQTALNDFLGAGNEVTLIETDVDITGAGTASGTWTVPSSGTIEFYAVKAANAYAFYLVDPAEGTGSWSTFDLWLAGYGGEGPLDVSHFVGYNPGSTSVPEPGTLMLLGGGLVGLALYGRKSFKR